MTLARHGKPALSRACRLNAEEYRHWWSVYEEGGILPGQTPPPTIVAVGSTADVIVASTRRRAIETAQMVADGKPIQTDSVFIEAPLPPPGLPGFIRLNPRIWGFVSRFLWWFFNHHHGEESRGQSQVRAKQAADQLIHIAETGRDVLLIAHGFFNRVIEIELKRAGWRRVSGRGYKYWSTKRYERV